MDPRGSTWTGMDEDGRGREYQGVDPPGSTIRRRGVGGRRMTREGEEGGG